MSPRRVIGCCCVVLPRAGGISNDLLSCSDVICRQPVVEPPDDSRLLDSQQSGCELPLETMPIDHRQVVIMRTLLGAAMRVAGVAGQNL